MKQDYYDGLIQERGRDVAASLLADECRKADVEIELLGTALRSIAGGTGKEGSVMTEIGKRRLDELLRSTGEIDHCGMGVAVIVLGAKLDTATNEEYVLVAAVAGWGSTWVRARDVAWAVGG